VRVGGGWWGRRGEKEKKCEKRNAEVGEPKKSSFILSVAFVCLLVVAWRCCLRVVLVEALADDPEKGHERVKNNFGDDAKMMCIVHPAPRPACPIKAPRVAQEANYTALTCGAPVRRVEAWTGDDHTSKAAHPGSFMKEIERSDVDVGYARLVKPRSHVPHTLPTQISLQICIGSSTQRKDDKSAVLGRRQQTRL